MLTFLRSFVRKHVIDEGWQDSNGFHRGKPVDHSRSSFTDALSAARAGQVWDDSRSEHERSFRA